jgi:hypothetical protein
MPIASPVRYSPSVETLRDDEAETLDDLKESLHTIQKITHEDYGHAVRSVHAKGHAIMEGTFEVAPGLGPELAQGLFAIAGVHKAVVRLSTNAGDILDDSISLPRGLALKVLDVTGQRLEGASGATQDFILVDGPVFTVPNTSKFAGSLKMLAKTTDKAEGTKIVVSKVLQVINGALGAVGMDSPKLAGLGGAPPLHPLGEAYFSVTPFRYGEYIAKFRLRPLSEELTKLTHKKIETKGHPNGIREAVKESMAGIDAVWAFEVQLCRDLNKQPVEDPTVEWKEHDTQFRQVATLRLSHQDSWDAALVKRVDDEMRFSVWTGLAAHQPLGNINRARRETYDVSAAFRARANRCPMHEPRS